MNNLINSNLEYYQGYVLAANYFYTNNEKQKALDYYKKALTKEFENTNTKTLVEEKIATIENGQ